MKAKKSRLSELTISAIVQAVGSVAALITISYLAHTAGPLVQGLFSSLKAEFEFFSALLLVGLPQAIFYHVASKKQDYGQALTLSVAHAIISLVVIGVWAAVALHGTHVNFPSFADVVFFALAVAIGIFYANTRALVLAVRPAITFSIVTALPSVFILFVVLFGVKYLAYTDSSSSLIANPVIFVIAYSLAAVVVISIIRRNMPLHFAGLVRKDVVSSLRFGFATWIPAISQAGSNLFAIRWIGEKLDLAEGVAGFSTAFAIVLAILAPLSMVIPIFFKWWAPIGSEQRTAELAKSLGVIFLLSCVCIALIWSLEEQIVGIMFGEEYLRFVGIYSAMAMTVPVQATFRMWGVYCSSSGRPSRAAWLEFVRIIVVIVCIVSFGVDLKSTVYAWILAEFISLMLGVLFLAATRGRNTAESI